MFETISFAIKSIRRRKMRSTLTVTGIAIGVLSVVIISMIGDIGKNAVNSELDSMGISGICLRSVSGSSKMLTGNELSLVQENENVVEASPLISKITNINVHQKATQAIVWGIDSNADRIVSMKLVHGRLINKSDVKSNSKVCVVDEAFAKQHYGRSNIVGKNVMVSTGAGYDKFSVIGIVSSGGNILQGIMGEVVPTFLYAPFSTITSLSGNKGFSQIVAKLKDGVKEEEAAGRLATALNQSLNAGNTIRYENLNGQKEKLNGVLDTISLILAVIGGISLIVAGLSIMTVMLVTVNERTREIGIKKSIGAKRKAILNEFLCEALLLSLFGSIIGTIAGVSLGIIGCAIFSMPVIINIKTIAFCILFSLLIGTGFGVYPARKAAFLKPVDALRYE